MDSALIIFDGANFSRLLGGLGVSLRIAVLAVVISLFGGVLFGMLMNSKNVFIRACCRVILETVRIVPQLVWLFVFYFEMTKAFHIHLDAEVASIIVFSLWGIAEMGDLVRGAITSLPLHQWQSGMAIGLTKTQLYRYIILPQAVRRLLPPAINLVTRMIKTTSLVVLIGVIEVLKVGQQVIEVSIFSAPSAAFWVYGFIFFLYFIVCWPVSLAAKKLEQYWARRGV
ncbi:MAG: amino acid ABC transporter permease [Acidaminococcaceae bacterium]|nr:amino acid ABC transporter permease [Acidaminococcaceae bacterium]